MLRLRTLAGDLTADQLRAVADLAATFGQARVHVTTRQGLEIHYVPEDALEQALGHMKEAGLLPGIAGPRLRSGNMPW